MRKRVLLVVLLLAGCTSGVYKVPAKEYQQQVKTLGILPVLVDSRSRIEHPDAAAILELLRRGAAGHSEMLVEELRRKKGYFDVRLIPEPAQMLADELLIKVNIDELGQPAGYQLNLANLAEICRDSAVDGLLLISLQGAVHNTKRWSRNTFEHLTTDYNDIMATASVVKADGQVLWVMNGKDAEVILPLQYADFDEAFFNKTDAVKLKQITLSGLEKTLLSVPGKQGEPLRSQQITAWLKVVTAAISPSIFR